MSELLRVEDLRVYYQTSRGPVKAVDGVTFSLKPAERLGLVGESGSGKSTIALSLLRMIKSPGEIAGGAVYLDDTNLLKLTNEAMRQTRLAKISMVAQGAMNSLNPVKRIKEQFRTGMRDHGVKLEGKVFDKQLAELLEKVGLRPAVANMFPHELSGGMKQRVCIAFAITLKPRVIIADEPTSALDVVVQWQVINTLRTVQQELGAAVIQIGHDMGLMAQSVDRIGVMYAGKLVELATVRDLFAEPMHPYSKMLITSLPSLTTKHELVGIPGSPPSLLNPKPGCPFAPRCPFVMDVCKTTMPPVRMLRSNHEVACHLYNAEAAS